MSKNNLAPEGCAPSRLHIILSSAALCVLSLALPIMTLQVYNRILPNPDSGTLPILVVGVLVCVTLEAALRIARSWMIAWTGAVYEHALSQEAMRHVLASDVSKAGAFGVGEFLNRMTSVGRLKDFHSGYSLMTLTELCFAPLYLGVTFYIAHTLALVPLSLILIFTGIMMIEGRRIRETLTKREAADDTRYDYLISCLKGVHTVKAFALENLLSRRYEALQEKTGLASFHASLASTEAFNAGTMLSHLMMATVMTVGAVMAVSGTITTGALIATLLLSGRMMQPIQRALGLFARYQDYAVAAERVNSIFELPRSKAPSVAVTLPEAWGALQARGLSHGALSNLDFDLMPGETVSIAASGSGKTELMEILSGLYPAEKGMVRVDGVPIADFPPEDLVRRIGYLPTEGIVFRGTIRDNITRFGAIPEAEAHEIAALLGVDRDVARLPAGFDTVLTETGADGVPPGLRQRIAMARVLGTRPRIILFDEADRALDHVGYNLVYSLLAKLSGKASIIIVSGDENLSSLAKRHYMLQDGKLVQRAAIQDKQQGLAS